MELTTFTPGKQREIGLIFARLKINHFRFSKDRDKNIDQIMFI